MAHERDPERKDPDISGTRFFVCALVAIVLVMTGIYFFTNLDAVHIARNTTPPVMAPAPEPRTPPPSTMSR